MGKGTGDTGTGDTGTGDTDTGDTDTGDTDTDESGASGAVVRRYLDRLVAHDWEAMAACLADDVVRVGPFGDTYTPRQVYVAFLTALMPALPGYSMRIDRVVSAGRCAVVELTEVVDVGGTALETPEALVFDLDAEGRIAHISIYIQRLGEVPALS